MLSSNENEKMLNIYIGESYPQKKSRHSAFYGFPCKMHYPLVSNFFESNFCILKKIALSLLIC